MGSTPGAPPDQTGTQQDIPRRPDMAGETTITIVGNLTDDPELRIATSRV